MVETAQQWGWSPSAVVRGADDPREHHPADYNLAMAVKTLKDEKCPSCGVPIWHAFSEDSAIAFTEDEQTCYGCKYQETERKDRKDRPGERYIARAVPEEGYDALPSRSDFYERMHKKAIRMAELEAEKKHEQAA